MSEFSELLADFENAVQACALSPHALHIKKVREARRALLRYVARLAAPAGDHFEEAV